jgi:hypothetical protein
MASLSFATPVEEASPLPARPGVAAKTEAVVVAGFGNPVAVDYLAYVQRRGDRIIAYPGGEGGAGQADKTVGRDAVGAVFLFLPRRLTARNRPLLDEVLAFSDRQRARFVCLVSSFRVHFGDRRATEAEDYALGLARRLPTRLVVFRPGHVISANSRAGAWLRRLGFCRPLVPRHLRGCCVEGANLFDAIESQRRDPRPRRLRMYTLLGPNRPWKDILAEHGARGLLPACLMAVCGLLSLLLIGQLAGLIVGLATRRWSALRSWNFDTLRPRSIAELLALYNPYNHRHVKVVGYNNGVVHFGHRYPGRTVVSTVNCNRIRRAGPDVIKADAGATILRARRFLAEAGQELPVVPNYSYVCLGTAFFVPIHGSASDFSCVADTIIKVIFYNPVTDRVLVTGRHDPAFCDLAYNLWADVLLLRLYLRVGPRSVYYVRREELANPGSTELLAVLEDQHAANVEIRKARAARSGVSVYRYYNDPGAAPGPVLELPRDSLGRLWDRLEENRVTSFLMHAATRYLAWHVELFFTAHEFEAFWADHSKLPLRKIQLRYIRRDGLLHSPFRLHNCVSADMFMLRRHRRAFETYLKQTFAVVRSNPGKHSW